MLWKGVVSIKTSCLDLEVGKIFKEAFINLTKRLSSIDLKEKGFQETGLEEPVFERIEGEIQVVIYTKGRFESIIICSMSPELGDSIILGMNKGKPMDSEEKKLYLKEYMNIICGHGLSNINSHLGAASRLSIPYLGEPEGKKVAAVMSCQRESVFLVSPYGNMAIEIDYQTKQ